MSNNVVLAIVGGLLGLIILCTTVLVLHGDADAAAFKDVVLPISTGVVSAFAAIKGVQSGSQATVNPPPDA